MQAVKRVFVQETEAPTVQLQLLPVNHEDLQVIRSHVRVSVFCRGFCFFTYENSDRFSRDYCLVQLHLSGHVKLKYLSRLFELSYQHCSNAVAKFKRSGVAGFVDHIEKRYRNRQKIEQKIGEFILRYREQGCGYREISQMIRFRFRKNIKEQSLRAWIYKQNKIKKQEQSSEAGQLELYEHEDIIDQAEEGVWHWNSYAGSMILYGMIEWSGFLKPFEEYIVEDEDKKKTSWGVRRVILTLFFLHALRLKSIEQSKHLVGHDFAEVVGGDFLRQQWLRYAVDEIAENKGFDQAIDAYYKDLIRLTDRRDRIYYTDGHFSSYHGKRPVPKGYDPRRQMGFRGRNAVYLHNSQGEIVYLFESPANKNLSHDIEALVGDMEDFGVKLNRRTLMFDRGGFSQRCFLHLKMKKKMYFVTYLKNRKNEREESEDQFKLYRIQTEDGDEVEYKIFEKDPRQTRYGKVRVIVLLSSDGKQIPILTSNPYLKPETIVYLLQRRWREENCFKYMIEHFGIDLLTTYKTEAAPDHVVKRANPERQKINGMIAQKTRELEKLRNELAKKISENKNQDQQTVAEFLEKEKEIEFAIKNIQVDIDLLSRKRETLVSKIEVNLKDESVIIAQKRRLLINAIKAMNYNCEKWLQFLFKGVHAKKDETLSLIRNLWRQPGQVRNSDRSVEIRLKPLDTGSMRSSLDQILKKLKENNQLRMPDGRFLEISQTL
jgi:hypothetical protein